MWVNVRGCSGSGKSYSGFRLLEEFGPGARVLKQDHWFRKEGKPMPKKPKLVGHVLPGGLLLVGRYELKKSTVKDGKGYTGGVDGWHPVNSLTRMCEDFYDMYPHAYVESLMISGTFYRWHLFAKGAYIADDYHGSTNQDSVRGWREPRDITFATLNTPLDVALEGVQQRNGGRKVDEDQIKEHRKRVLQAAQKFAKAGDRSVYLDREHSYEQVKMLLREGGWDPEGDTNPPTDDIILG